ncbi:MAG: hypothetical protein WBQ94_17150 [Terracidiphilus sp.]
MRANKPVAIPETDIDKFAAICKDCGNGTLNNAAIPTFRILGGFDEFEDETYVQCKCCGSTHVDVVVL